MASERAARIGVATLLLYYELAFLFFLVRAVVFKPRSNLEDNWFIFISYTPSSLLVSVPIPRAAVAIMEQPVDCLKIQSSDRPYEREPHSSVLLRI